MSRHVRRPLRFESLEGKLLLSTARPGLAPAAPRPSAAIASTPLDGTLVASSYNVSGSNGGTETAKIGLAGYAGSMGRVNGLLTEGINESVEVVAKANLVLANSRGSVTMTVSHLVIMQNLTMPYNMGFTADYTITSATGAYAHARGGTGSIDVSPDIGDPSMHIVLHTTH